MKLTRVFDLLDHLQSYAPKQDILNAKAAGQWQQYSFDAFSSQVQLVSAALLASGFHKGDKVALMAANIPEWNFVDFGSQQLGMPNVPIYPTISNEDLVYILNHSEARILFISDKSVYQKLQAVSDKLQYLEQIISFRTIDGVMDFTAFQEKGRLAYDAAAIEDAKQAVSGEDMFTLLYTSGTTGKPKGVMLSHRNILSNLEVCRYIAPFTSQWRALSFLPLNHIYERFLNILYLYHGVSIYYAESFETIGENCREVRPQIFVAVPRVLERVLERITTAGENLSGLKKSIFDWSMQLAERYELDGANGIGYEVQRKLADRLVYRKWRAAV
ncbi:MAG TPA: AMP-binding protein, partial [Chitinophagaceae bacterium]|nr:AMP-binding protein [Chitinophagaceae bacterium]